MIYWTDKNYSYVFALTEERGLANEVEAVLVAEYVRGYEYPWKVKDCYKVVCLSPPIKWELGKWSDHSSKVFREIVAKLLMGGGQHDTHN